MYMNRSISRVLAAAVASAGFAVPMPTMSASLSCTSSTFTAIPDGNGNINVTCSQPGSSSATCSISAVPSSLPVGGGTVTVTTNCGANTSVSGGKSVAGSGSSWTDSIPASTATSTQYFVYTVTGDGGSKSATVSQAGSGSTPPPTGGAISCSGYASTIVIDLPWGAAGSAAPRVVSKGFGGNSIIVARFTTPDRTAAGVTAQIKSAEWGDQQHQRSAALSTSPCDFPSTNPLGRLASILGGSTSPTVTYQVGGTSTYYAVLQPSTTYYYNIKNEVKGSPTCSSGESCNMFVELQKPNGL
jgi:hypothetical protein